MSINPKSEILNSKQIQIFQIQNTESRFHLLFLVLSLFRVSSLEFRIFILGISIFCGWGISGVYAADECLPCHKIEVESFAQSKHAPEAKCDICHGSPAEHLSCENKKSNIINPAALSTKKANLACAQCHRDKSKDVGERFKAIASLHDNLRCYECHNVHLTQSSKDDIGLFADDLSVNCSLCHKGKSENLSNSPHSYAGLECGDCHKLHKAKTISEDIEEELDKCLSCHPAQELEFKYFYSHPLRQRQIRCSSCHDPHSERFPAMLKKDVNDICGNCHGGTVIEAGRHPLSKGTNHSYRALNCMDCHRPHGSNFSAILKYNIDNICKTCHN